MKRLLVFLCLLVPFLLLAQSNYKTLFLGNSYTYVNDLPAILRNLTLAGGDTLQTGANTPGGYTLQGHSTNPTSLGLIASQNWDFVVMQEQSQRPSFPQSQVQSQVYPYAAILNDSVKANDSCSITVFYMTWGRKYGDASNCSAWPPVCTYEGMSAELRRSYLNMANQNQALVAPVGMAWWEAIKRDSTLELFNQDQSHPAYTGSYLAACVFYGTMYRRSPVGLNYQGSLDTTTASFLQQVAHDVVFDSLVQWRIGLDDANAAFAWNSNSNGEVAFSNNSLNSSAYSWNFGDGDSSNLASPTHTYATSGSYLVTLIATDGCTSDTMIDTVQVVIVGIEDFENLPIQIAPNPSEGRFNLQANELESGNYLLNIYDLSGKMFLEREFEVFGSEFSCEIDLLGFPSGIYLLRFGNSTKRISRKLILK